MACQPSPLHAAPPPPPPPPPRRRNVNNIDTDRLSLALERGQQTLAKLEDGAASHVRANIEFSKFDVEHIRC